MAGSQIIMQTSLDGVKISGELALFEELLKNKEKTQKQVEKALKSGRSIMSDLMRVEWSNINNQRSLKADWRGLFFIWFLELSPSSLGAWNADKSHVTIRKRTYITDLRTRHHFMACIAAFQKQHPNLSSVKVGMELLDPKTKRAGFSFRFTGPGTTVSSGSKQYTTLEWYLGSYKTTFRVIGHDKASRSIKVEVKVTNNSTWHSASRTPKAFQNKGVPEYFVANRKRSEFGPGGTFSQTFVWTEIIEYDERGVVRNHYQLGVYQDTNKVLFPGRGIFPIRRTPGAF